MKKIGLVATNHKVEKYKAELNKKGFTDLEILPNTEDSTTIRVNVLDEEYNAALKKVTAIAYAVEAQFKRKN